MTDKSERKRTTVTTVETHEVWIIRRVVVGSTGDEVTRTPLPPRLPNTPLSETEQEQES